MKRLFGCLFLLGGLVAVGAAGWGWWTWTRFLEAFPREVTGDPQPIEIEVPAGASALRIYSILESAGLIADARLARVFHRFVLDEAPLQAGEYRFQPPLTPSQVFAKLADGEVILEQVTVIEGLTLMETADLLARNGFGDRAELTRLMSDPTPILDLDPLATNLEGYLFPDTYSFPRRRTERQVVDALVENFRRQAGELLAGRDVRRLVTLASIVEKEATLDAERPIIAGVYANRLRRGIGLYADPTIIYGLKLEGTWDGNLRRDDLRRDGPYNTYVRPGLPPSPICSPGRASLRAAADPADVPYLYFVSRNDGSHVFAESLREHNRNVDEWQRRYWRERRMQQR